MYCITEKLGFGDCKLCIRKKMLYISRVYINGRRWREKYIKHAPEYSSWHTCNKWRRQPGQTYIIILPVCMYMRKIMFIYFLFASDHTTKLLVGIAMRLIETNTCIRFQKVLESYALAKPRENYIIFNSRLGPRRVFNKMQSSFVIMST